MSTKNSKQSKRQHAMPVHAVRTRQKMKTIKMSIKRLREQAESLGLLDPLDVGPAAIYDPREPSNE